MLLEELRVRLGALTRELASVPAVTLTRPRPVHRKQLRDYLVDRDLLKVGERLFADGHHARAVEEAFKYMNNLVKTRSGRTELDGAQLMRTALSAKNPVLKLNPGASTSEQDEQQGYMDICAGSMTGIRNPRAHESEWEDSEEHALQLLILADHLIGRIKAATKTPAAP